MRATMLCVCLLSGIYLAAESRADGYDQWNPLRPQPPHLVLREHAAPQPLAVPQHPYPNQGHLNQGHLNQGQPSPSPSLPNRHSDLASRHSLKKDMAYVTGGRPPIPQATTQLQQKTPYSYGYFGAIEKRHWSMHFGSRQNFTRWTQR